MAEKLGPLKKGPLHEYGLSFALGLLFLVSWVAQACFQWAEEAEIAKMHGEVLTLASFLPTFARATFENWQSEFLQLFTFILLTSVLLHKGSPESRDGDELVQAALARIEKRLDNLTAIEFDRIEREEMQELHDDIEISRSMQRQKA